MELWREFCINIPVPVGEGAALGDSEGAPAEGEGAGTGAPTAAFSQTNFIRKKEKLGALLCTYVMIIKNNGDDLF